MTRIEHKYHPTRSPHCRWSLALIAAYCVTRSVAAFGETPAESEVEPVAPEAIGAVVSCVICHGVDGEGKAKLGTPRIGGMGEWYLARQLRNFQTGIRGATDDDVFGTQMRAMALTLENATELEELARYLSTRAPPEAPETVSGNVERGEELYAVCAACHGADGSGNEQLNAPALRGQFDWYLVRQLNNYQKGLRGTNPNDTYGAQMVPIVKSLADDQDIIDVVAYINTL
jgi:cytochrome c oxidase subunit 2